MISEATLERYIAAAESVSFPELTRERLESESFNSGNKPAEKRGITPDMSALMLETVAETHILAEN